MKNLNIRKIAAVMFYCIYHVWVYTKNELKTQKIKLLNLTVPMKCPMPQSQINTRIRKKMEELFKGRIIQKGT